MTLSSIATERNKYSHKPLIEQLIRINAWSGGRLMKEKEIDYFTALYNVARVINASLDPPLILAEIVRCVVSALQLKAAGIRLLDTKGKKLFLGASDFRIITSKKVPFWLKKAASTKARCSARPYG
jgi:hypothetical protein